jgi:hypothetical protein
MVSMIEEKTFFHILYSIRNQGYLLVAIYFLGPTWHCVVGRNFGSFVTHGT